MTFCCQELEGPRRAADGWRGDDSRGAELFFGFSEPDVGDALNGDFFFSDLQGSAIDRQDRVLGFVFLVGGILAAHIGTLLGQSLLYFLFMLCPGLLFFTVFRVAEQ